MMMYHLVFPVIFAFANCKNIVHRGGLHNALRETNREVRQVDWDYFMLVTEWPQSACEHENNTLQHECVIPSVVKGWVLHGLWPSTDHGEQPQYCRDWPFDWDKIKDLRQNLTMYWPNLFADTSLTSFWNHEYTKHGTCAASVHGFETEHDFFQKTMELRTKFDPMRVLKDQGIVPNGNTYQGSAIKKALNAGYNVKACAECQHVQDIGYVLLGSYVCLSKDLNLIDCTNCEHECYDSDDVYYHPLHY